MYIRTFTGLPVFFSDNHHGTGCSRLPCRDTGLVVLPCLGCQPLPRLLLMCQHTSDVTAREQVGEEEDESGEGGGVGELGEKEVFEREEDRELLK